MFEMLFIRDLKPPLNKQKDSISSKLFQNILFISLRFVILSFLLSFFILISIVFSLVYFKNNMCYFYSVYISSFHCTQLYILIMMSRRRRNVDFTTLIFITKGKKHSGKLWIS